jgi:hypothetical protein
MASTTIDSTCGRSCIRLLTGSIGRLRELSSRWDPPVRARVASIAEDDGGVD